MFRIQHHDQTDSTNDDAAKLLGEPHAAGLVLTADYQRAGRGRHARPWVAPPGSSLLCTAILPATVRSDGLWAVTFWAGLAVADAIEAASGLRAGLVWPNDLTLGGRKCCGVLCVSRVAGEFAWVGCGTGINVVRPAGDAELAALDPPPAFLSDYEPQIDRSQLLAELLAAYERRLPELNDPEGIARQWQRRAELNGKRYLLAVDGEAEPFSATARRIAPGGGLVVERDGAERTIALADARVLR
ncbi:MAG: biotin--[acetyl-CoA-carboxylase] ligase [Candidatus Baltobacteraceae bacterium]|jgi:BirA family biotin operon repressor/biotin-[acetyl-CoA-carboxylase] ligase